jgi:hypothetical protein
MSEVERKFLFFNAAIQGGPASGDTRYFELQGYYNAICVLTCKTSKMGKNRGKMIKGP